MIFIDNDASVMMMDDGDKDSPLTHVSFASIVGSIQQVDVVIAYTELFLHTLDDCIV